MRIHVSLKPLAIVSIFPAALFWLAGCQTTGVYLDPVDEPNRKILEYKLTNIYTRYGLVPMEDGQRPHEFKEVSIPADVASVYYDFSTTKVSGGRTRSSLGVRSVHRGIDFAGATGYPIISAADGTVKRVETEGYGGRVVEIYHGNGISTNYVHLNSIVVRIGQRVKRGDVIAGMGNTGKSFGVHLHFDVLLDGQHVNPWKYFVDGTPNNGSVDALAFDAPIPKPENAMRQLTLPVPPKDKVMDFFDELQQKRAALAKSG